MKARTWVVFLIMTFGAMALGAGTVFLGSYVLQKTDNLWSTGGAMSSVWILGTVVSGFACAKLMKLWRKAAWGIALVFSIFAAMPVAWALDKYMLSGWLHYLGVYAVCTLLMAAGQTAAIMTRSNKRGRSMKATLQFSEPPVSR